MAKLTCIIKYDYWYEDTIGKKVRSVFILAFTYVVFSSSVR